MPYRSVPTQARRTGACARQTQRHTVCHLSMSSDAVCAFAAPRGLAGGRGGTQAKPYGYTACAAWRHGRQELHHSPELGKVRVHSHLMLRLHTDQPVAEHAALEWRRYCLLQLELRTDRQTDRRVLLSDAVSHLRHCQICTPYTAYCLLPRAVRNAVGEQIS
jgi:hypothetical protein